MAAITSWISRMVSIYTGDTIDKCAGDIDHQRVDLLYFDLDS